MSGIIVSEALAHISMLNGVIVVDAPLSFTEIIIPIMPDMHVALSIIKEQTPRNGGYINHYKGRKPNNNTFRSRSSCNNRGK